MEVSTVDLLPTVEDLLGIVEDEKTDGVSLVPVLKGKSVQRDVPIMATNWPDNEGNKAVRSVCLINDGIKYIEQLETGDAGSGNAGLSRYHTDKELYFLEEDHNELHNRAEQSPELSATMSTVLRQGLEQALKPYKSATYDTDLPPISNQLKAQLELLGYVIKEEK